ncbi:MAG: HAD family hydrolase [Eubacteriales bacterium]|nr:HAD family hydrolase [Eubacteriales bacterium]
MNKKLIFLDIDGTLTEPGSNIPPDSALEAIRGAQAKGHLVFLCSGRNYAMLSPLLKYGFDGVVASAGGYVTVGDEVIYDHPMTQEQAQTALTALHGEGVFCTVETRDITYGDENLGSFLEGSTGGQGNSEIERWRKALAESLDIHPMSEYDGTQPVYKVVIMCLRDEQLQPARDLLEKDFQFVIQEISDPDHPCLNGELINRAFDKGRGVLRVCEHLGIPVEDTIGFGDSMNDIEMIRTVATSVCMANGSKALQAESDIICPAVTEDGMAKAFKDLGLCD